MTNPFLHCGIIIAYYMFFSLSSNNSPIISLHHQFEGPIKIILKVSVFRVYFFHFPFDFNAIFFWNLPNAINAHLDYIYNKLFLFWRPLLIFWRGLNATAVYANSNTMNLKIPKYYDEIFIQAVLLILKCSNCFKMEENRCNVSNIFTDTLPLVVKL